MIKVEVMGTVQDVAAVITALYESNDREVLITGDAADEINDVVIDNLKNFKVEYTDNTTDEGYHIRIFD